MTDSKDLEAEDEAWWQQHLREQAERARQREAFGRAVKRAIEADGAFEVRSQFEHRGGKIIIHRSTRPGVAYQVTFVDEDGPVGHADTPSLDAAVKRAWEDVHPQEKLKYKRGNSSVLKRNLLR